MAILIKYSATFLLACFYFIIPSVTISQSLIKGKVLTEETGTPLSGASIYLNNTSIGTTANEDGSFFINAGNSIANAELVVSYTERETLVFWINMREDSGKIFVCKLKEKTQPLHNVLVISDKNRKQWLDIFTDNFLGVTHEAKKSSITNMQQIYFVKSDQPGFIIAKSDSPLIIINRELGYKITFDLIEFSFHEKKGSYFYGYSRYENIEDPKKYDVKRKQAYTGSSMHFYRSLINNRLQEEGYSIFLLKGKKKLVEETSITINKTVIQRAPQPKDSLVAIAGSSILFKDTVASDNHFLKWEGDLQVQYAHNTPAKKYLNKRGFFQGTMHDGFNSVLQMTQPEVWVTGSGILIEPLSVNYTGFWIYEKVANLLPNDYSFD